MVAAALTAPLGFDEAFNLQVPINLAKGDGYATDGSVLDGVLRPFDAYMTTGPVLLAPIGGLTWMLGSQVWVFRIMPIVFYLLLVIGSAVLGRRYAGTGGAWAASAAVLSVAPLRATLDSSPLYGAGDALGEVATATLVVAAALVLGRPRSAGLLIGLAVLTKLVAVMVIPAFVLAVTLAARTPRSSAEAPYPEGLIDCTAVTRARRLVDPMVSFLVAVSAPVVAWQVIRVSALGWDESQSRNGEFLQIVLSAGSGLQGGDQGNIVVQAFSRLLAASDVLWWPVWVAALVSVTCALVARIKSRRWMVRVLSATRAETVALAGGGLTVFAWWLLVSSRDWPRHVLPAVFVLVAVGAACTAGALQRSRGQTLSSLGAVSGVLAGVVGISFHAFVSWQPPGVTLEEQREVAALIADNADTIRFVGWYQAPDVSLISGLPAKQLTSAGGTVVLTPPHDPYEARLQELIVTRLCNDIYQERFDFVVCTVEPGPLPIWAEPGTMFGSLPVP